MDNDKIELTGECPMCKLPWSIEVREADLEKYRQGEAIYSCFPYLNASQRELLITGICDDCWNKMFEDD